MADFKFAFPFLSSDNDEPLPGTILGNASPVSDRWRYLRDPPPPDDDAGRSGTAPNVEPPPGSPEFQAAEASLATLPQEQDTAGVASLAAAAGRAPAMGEGLAAAVDALAKIGSRVGTIGEGALSLAASPAALLSVPLTAIPINSDGQTLPLGDRFRARQPPGQRSVFVERRVSDGLLGTSVGAKWEEVPPLDATLRIGHLGLRTLVVDADELRNTLGPDAANQLLATGRVIDRQADAFANRTRTAPGGQGDLPPPPPLAFPAKIEMQIWSSTDQGAMTTSHEATREQAEQVCPNLSKYERYAMEAAAKYKAAGLPNGKEYGLLVHRDVELRLEEEGMPDVRPELAVREGISPSYSKGSSRIDIVELHRDHITVCVYEVKTGGARIPREVVKRYSREAALYAEFQGLGYPNVYFIPIRVP